MFEGILDNETARMEPLLLRLYDSHRIYALAKDRRAPARSELVGIVLDMFQAELSPREAELVTDVLTGLMGQAERDLRQALAERIAGSEKAPLRLVLHLANDEIEVADSILRNSPVLNDLDLIYIIKSQGPEYWRAIALRKLLSDQVMDLLAETEEPETVQNLADNAHITLTAHSMKIMAHMALEEETLAGSLIAREDIPKEIALRLYRFVGEELKREITDRFDINSEALDQELDKAVQDLSSPDKMLFAPSAHAIETARAAFNKKELDVQAMVKVLRRGDISMFVAQFSVYADLSPHMVIDILSQRYGQGLAVACKGLDIEKADFLTMFFLTQKVRNTSRIANKYDVSQALSCYERTTKKMALRLLENSKSK